MTHQCYENDKILWKKGEDNTIVNFLIKRKIIKKEKQKERGKRKNFTNLNKMKTTLDAACLTVTQHRRKNERV